MGIGETGTLHEFLHHQISFTRTTGSRCPDKFPAAGLARMPDVPRWAAGIAEEEPSRPSRWESGEATPGIIMPKDGRARRVPMTPSAGLAVDGYAEKCESSGQFLLCRH